MSIDEEENNTNIQKHNNNIITHDNSNIISQQQCTSSGGTISGNYGQSRYIKKVGRYQTSEGSEVFGFNVSSLHIFVLDNLVGDQMQAVVNAYT